MTANLAPSIQIEHRRHREWSEALPSTKVAVVLARPPCFEPRIAPLRRERSGAAERAGALRGAAGSTGSTEQNAALRYSCRAAARFSGRCGVHAGHDHAPPASCGDDRLDSFAHG